MLDSNKEAFTFDTGWCHLARDPPILSRLLVIQPAIERTYVAPDQFASSDVCLSGCCRGISLVAMGFPAVRGVKGLRGDVLWELVLSFCRKQSCLRLMIHNGDKLIYKVCCTLHYSGIN